MESFIRIRVYLLQNYEAVLIGKAAAQAGVAQLAHISSNSTLEIMLGLWILPKDRFTLTKVQRPFHIRNVFLVSLCVGMQCLQKARIDAS